MTDEKLRNRVTSLLQQGIENALEAEQVSVTDMRTAQDLAGLAIKRLRQASDASHDMETAGERRVAGLIAGQLMIHLREQFRMDL